MPRYSARQDIIERLSQLREKLLLLAILARWKNTRARRLHKICQMLDPDTPYTPLLSHRVTSTKWHLRILEAGFLSTHDGLIRALNTRYLSQRVRRNLRERRFGLFTYYLNMNDMWFKQTVSFSSGRDPKNIGQHSQLSSMSPRTCHRPG
jgi:hypothetical protein